MRTRQVACCFAVVLIPATAATAAAPQPPSITLRAGPSTIVYSGVSALTGRLSARRTGGLTVRLEEDATRPYGDSYRRTGRVTRTAANGAYAFSVKPLLNTQYRVVALTSPRATSPPKLVLVRALVGMRVSDTTPSRGSRVRFAGAVFPAHDGRLMLIQRQSSPGAFSTVARTTLRHSDDTKSTYSLRVPVNRDGVYRVKFVGDEDHVNGFSRLRTLTVHG